MSEVKKDLERSLISRPVFHDEALICSVLRYGESDCVVRLFTRKQGRLTAFYKRGLSTKKNGAVQALALGRIGLVESHGRLMRMVSCDLDPHQAFGLLDIKSFGYRAYLAELLEKFLPEEEPAEELFLTLKEAYLAVDKAPRSEVLRAFEVKLLDYCGYWPEMPESRIRAFDPKNFRFTDEPTDETWDFSVKALELAKSMLIAKIGSINYEGRSELLMIGRIFQSRVRMMGCELKSANFLKQLKL